MTVEYWLGPIRPGDMPMLAAQMLAEGHDTPALRRAPGPARDDPRDVREEFQLALGSWCFSALWCSRSHTPRVVVCRQGVSC
jgi:hypothetical protein